MVGPGVRHGVKVRSTIRPRFGMAAGEVVRCVSFAPVARARTVPEHAETGYGGKLDAGDSRVGMMKQFNGDVGRDPQILDRSRPVFRAGFRDRSVDRKHLNLLFMERAAFFEMKAVKAMDAEARQFDDRKADDQKRAGSCDKGSRKKMHRVQ